MAMILAPDDVRTNMWVSVHSAVPRKAATQMPGMPMPIVVEVAQSPAPPGVPLRVIGLSLPFVACRSVATHDEEEQMAILDLRTVRLCRISEAYVKAIAAFTPAPARKHKVDEEALDALLKQARFTEEERRARGLPPSDGSQPGHAAEAAEPAEPAAEAAASPAPNADDAPPPVRPDAPDAPDKAAPQRSPRADRGSDGPEFKPWQRN